MQKILNKVYCTSLEFGKNWRKPISEIVEDFFSEMSDQEKKKVCDCITCTRDEIEKYFYCRYNHNDDKANEQLQIEGYKWIKQKYIWMNEKNIRHAISQAMYYAWHG